MIAASNKKLPWYNYASHPMWSGLSRRKMTWRYFLSFDGLIPCAINKSLNCILSVLTVSFQEQYFKPYDEYHIKLGTLYPNTITIKALTI